MGTTMLSRDELKTYTDRYLDALQGHAPNRLPLAGKVRYTENGQRLRLGDGLWGTTSKVGRYRIDIIDPLAQQVGYLGVIYQQKNACCIATRLKVEDGTISEIETIVAHPPVTLGAPGPNGAADLDTKDPHPVYTEKLKPAQRVSRAALIEAANAYFSGLENNDGTYPTPFTEDCNRLENGMQTTNNPGFGAPRSEVYERAGPNIIAMSPDAQFKSGYFRIVTAIRNRRFPVVDEEYGNVLAFGFFDHNGQVGEYKLTTGETINAGLRSPFTWEIAELFKVESGRLRQIEAVLNGVPYGMTSACWDA